MNTKLATAILITAGAILTAAGRKETAATEPVACVIIEQEKVLVGEVFTVTVLVEGCSTTPHIALTGCEEFQYTGPIGGGPTRNDDENTYAFAYHFVTTRVGKLAIGPFRVTAGSIECVTESAVITSFAPQQTAESRLDMSLSKQQCVVGEPLRLTVKWHIALPLSTVKAVDLQLPVLRDSHVDVRDPYERPGTESKNRVGLPVSGMRVLARLKSEAQDDQKSSTLTFSKIVVPKTVGRLVLDGATVFCTVLARPSKSYRAWNQYPAYFDNDFFENDIQGDRRRIYAQCDSLPIDVLPLPSEGRPASFTGLIGAYQMSVEAKPVHLSVGAPITLTIRVFGQGCLECVDLPPLTEQQRLASDFTIPRERSPGRIELDAKVFVQTIRPRHVGIAQIPPLELAWYDPESKAYGIARSKPIPLTVTAGHVVDAFDAEEANGASVKNVPESQADGLMYNYEGPDLLIDHDQDIFGWSGFVSWLSLLIVPPSVYVVLAVFVSLRNQRLKDPCAAHAKRAYARFQKQTQRLLANWSVRPSAADYVALEQAVRTYLANHLGMKAGALTYLDVEDRLKSVGVGDETLAALDELFSAFQAHRFAGTASVPRDPKKMIKSAIEIVEQIEEVLK